MAVIDPARVTPATGLFGGRVFRQLVRLSGAVISWNDARVTRNALRRLSNHELDDIGLSRGDVDRLTWRG